MSRFPVESLQDMDNIPAASVESRDSVGESDDDDGPRDNSAHFPSTRPLRPIRTVSVLYFYTTFYRRFSTKTRKPPSGIRPETPPGTNSRAFFPPGQGPRPDDPFPAPQGSYSASSTTDHRRIQASSPQAVSLSARTSRSNVYFVPSDGIDREVITSDIVRYLGNDALVRPGNYQNPQTGIQRNGYFIRAYRPLTAAMISDLMADSRRWEAERSSSRSSRERGSEDLYRYSTTHQSRQYHGPTESETTSSPSTYQSTRDHYYEYDDESPDEGQNERRDRRQNSHRSRR